MYRSFFDSYRNPYYYRYPYYGDYFMNRYRTNNLSDSYSSPFYDYEYGRPRRYGYPHERDNESRPNRRTRNRPGNRGNDDASTRSDSPTPAPPAPVPKPEPPKEEIAKLLKVKDIDLKIKDNSIKHKTDKYDCTEERERDGKTLPPECVLRRGESMKMDITYERKYEKAKNYLLVVFTIGEYPNETKGTKVQFEIDESGKGSFKEEQWGANLVSIKDETIELEVFIPCNCIVGEWNLAVTSKTFGKDKDGKDTVLRATYKHDADITIIFNAWCTNDPVYTAEDRDEYVLNDFGFLYTGNNPHHIRAKPWFFGQFADRILDCSLQLLRDGMNNNYKAMSNPVRVCRVLASMVNSADDNGVLVGNWSGDYSGGTRPSTWIGSTDILINYHKNQNTHSVKFGQCWVFSGVLTTVCRALGIPCRSVTNYDSAHDTDDSSTIDTFYIDDMLTVDEFSGDSVWNFHVWNEVYLKRTDLSSGYNGWQALDSTPQETSDGIYQCGPAPVIAIKKGRTDVGSDTRFVFSEVNADKVSWRLDGWGEWYVHRIKEKAVGNKISTKKPGKVHWSKDFKLNVKEKHTLQRKGEEMRLDITREYKYEEGTKQERDAVVLAYSLAGQPKPGVYKQDTNVKPLKMTFNVEDGVMIGQDIEINIQVFNPGHFERRIDRAVVVCYPEMYTGQLGWECYRFDFGMQRVDSQSSTYLKTGVRFDEYFSHLLEGNNIKILASIHVEPIGDEAEQLVVDECHFEFDKPELDVVGPDDSVYLKDQAQFTVIFYNPLPIALTNCRLIVKGSGFYDVNDMHVEDVPPDSEVPQSITLTARKRGYHSLVFELDTNELYAMTGMAEVEVK